jgi:hypothetical protein
MISKEALGLYKHFLFALGVVELTQIEAVTFLQPVCHQQKKCQKISENQAFS